MSSKSRGSAVAAKRAARRRRQNRKNAARRQQPAPKVTELVASSASAGAKLAAIAVIGTSVAIITPGMASAADGPGPSSSATFQARQVGGLWVLSNGKIVPPPAPPPPAPPSVASQAQQAGAQQVGGLYVLPSEKIWTPPTPGYTTVGGVPVGTVPAVRLSGYLPVSGLGGNLAYTYDPTGQTGGYLNMAVGLGVGGGFVMAYVPPGSPFLGIQGRLVYGPLTFNGSANFSTTRSPARPSSTL